jgi:hypothetical protein
MKPIFKISKNNQVLNNNHNQNQMINNQYLLHNKVKNKYIKNILNQMIHISEENIG